MKTLLVPIALHDALPSVFETALLVAQRFGSLIEGVSLRPALAEYVPVDMVGGMTWLRDEEADRAEAESAGQRFAAFMEAAGLPRRDPIGSCTPEAAASAGPRFRWRTDAPPGDAFLGQYARLFAATIVGRPGTDDAAPRMTTVETALFESGRPILLAPPRPPSSLGETIIIAWNGSTETARAVAFAMPFLRRARRVMVLSAEGGMVPGPSAEEVARSLACEGIEAVHKALPAGRLTPGEVFLDEAASFGCDLLIKGAYTQSRLRQMIFGGPTSHILSHAQIPVLMAH
ncbi:universal stress protein [Methylobacterium brachythecii]|uniref:Nucleotide-binding universal stress UspA family protein n=1 Tax=Methylobacterium brachythecii TaxID=1176177 RepID=A0A7W6F8R0_9HYPH|nr:universal stress protein [Methylobacterium brachythecii]MBB3904670.1 nucleotide-binding universal stress UspA family protein [Methylobacterium brachythecii]GLS44984.1 universal stress protein UspA [Methylobacterium brachythecii]